MWDTLQTKHSESNDVFQGRGDSLTSNSKATYQNTVDDKLHDTSNKIPATDCPEPINSIKTLTRRSIPIEDGSTAAGRLPLASRATPEEPTRTSKSWISNWSYHKSSIAAASIFTAITAAAIIFLAVLSVKKLRRNLKRRQKERCKGSLTDGTQGNNAIVLVENKRRRESLMFSDNHSRTYVVEHEGDSVTRVYCADRNRPGQVLDDINDHPDQEYRDPSLSIKTEAARHLEALNRSQRGRSGEISKPIVVVPSPLTPVVSRSAITVTSPDTAPDVEDNPEHQRVESILANNDEFSGLRNLFRLSFSALTPTTTTQTETALPSLEIKSETQKVIEIGSSTMNEPSIPRNVLRLPSIKKTISPMFTL